MVPDADAGNRYPAVYYFNEVCVSPTCADEELLKKVEERTHKIEMQKDEILTGQPRRGVGESTTSFNELQDKSISSLISPTSFVPMTLILGPIQTSADAQPEPEVIVS